MASMWSTGPYVGHFVSWDGGCLLIGRGGGAVPLHSHYSIQIAFGPTPGIQFRTSDREEWTHYAGAIIPSRQPHAMGVAGLRANVVIFVDPETRQGRALVERHRLHEGIAAIPAELLADVGPAIFSAWEVDQTAAAVERAAQRVIHVLTDGVEPSIVSDERILRAVAHVRANLDRPLTLDEVADVACLSPSRFRHLFVEQTGMALRPYILWRRLLSVWDLLMAGESLSTAAHAAGFADSAHLTRTSRSMFGLPPSAMQIAGRLRPDGPVDARQLASVSPHDAAHGPPAQPQRSIRR